MSNDNDPRDDAMREIEAALDEFADRYREQWMARSYDPGDARRAGEASDKLLALIRSKLPQPDAKHERAVEAWREKATNTPHQGVGFLLTAMEIEQATWLMRARPQPAPHFADRVKIRSANRRVPQGRGCGRAAAGGEGAPGR